MLYENILTTTERAYYLPVIAYRNHTLVSFCEKQADSGKIEKHLMDSLRLEKLSVSVKVFAQEQGFCSRLESLGRIAAEESEDAEREKVFAVIRAISL